MKQNIVKFLCLFILNKNKRKAFRNKHIKRVQTDQLEEIQNKLLGLHQDIQALDWIANSSMIKQASGLDRAVQLLAVEVLRDIDRVCRKHNIRYWIDFGTLLGALRHGGFIPWDDDIDISMLWEDYLRFQQLEASEFEYSIPHFQEGLWGKVYHKDFFDPWANSSSVFPIFVDIFPYHYLASSWTREEAYAYILQVASEKVGRCNELKRRYGDKASNWIILEREFKEKEMRLTSEGPTSYFFMSLK